LSSDTTRGAAPSPPAAPHHGKPLGRPAWAVLALLLLALGVFLHSPVLRYGFLGNDSYPIIAAARIGSLVDLAGTFTEELMDGRFPYGHFYRPILNLSVAVDHRLYGLQPRGYHRTDILILCANAILIALLCRTLPFRRPFWGAVAASLFLLTHPIQGEITSAIPRRGDSLSLLFLLLAVIAAGRPGRNGRAAAIALFSFLGVAAKETGAIIPVLVFARAYFIPEGNRPLRAGAAGRRALPAFAALALYMILRFAVLGGLGGREPVGPASFLAGVFGSFPKLAAHTLLSYPALDSDIDVIPLATALFLGIVAATLLLHRRGPMAGTARFLAVWLACGWLIHGLAGATYRWYVLHLLAPMALLVGLVLTERAGPREGRIPLLYGTGRALLALVLLLLAGANIAHTPLLKNDARKTASSGRAERILGMLEDGVEGARAGEVLSGEKILGLDEKAVRRGPGGVILPFSIQAWADLRFPDRTIRIVSPDEGEPIAAADEIVITIREHPGLGSLLRRGGDGE